MTPWDTTLETGDPLVDEQHRRIHQIVRDLEAADDTPGEIMRVLDTLTDYVAVHFATEEDLMAREEYAAHDVELHRIEHARLTERTRDYVLMFRDGDLTSTETLASFLRDWLSNHVEQCDRRLIEYVLARGGAARVPDELVARDDCGSLAS